MNRVRLLRKSLKLTQEDFAKKLDVTTPAVSQMELRDIETLSKAKAAQLSQTFNVSMEWLLEGKGEMFLPTVESNATFPDRELNFVNIPLIENAYAHLGATGIEGINVDLSNLPRISMFLDKATIPRNAELYCIYAKGDSMKPNIMHNDILVINLLPRAEWQYLPKGIYLIVTPDQQVLKLMERPPITETLVLKSINPEYSDITILSNDIVAIFSIISLNRNSSIL